MKVKNLIIEINSLKDFNGFSDAEVSTEDLEFAVISNRSVPKTLQEEYRNGDYDLNLKLLKEILLELIK